MIDDLDPKNRRRDGYDVAYMAVWCLGLFLAVMAVCTTIAWIVTGTVFGDGIAQLFIAGIGTIGTVAGAALGYQVGSRAPRRSTDPGGPEAAGPASREPPPSAAGPAAVPRRVTLPEL